MIPYKQLSLADIFSDCHEKFENDKPAFLSLLETHIDIDELIPISFRNHFYASTGRTRKYPLQAFGSMPSHASANPEIKQLYINGHFCYVFKFGIVTNGLGIIRHISFYKKNFMASHPDIVVEKKSDSSDEDKCVHDSKLLIPTLKDFFSKHPLINPKTFLGDAAFDTSQLYKSLLTGDTFGNDKHFSKAYIPLNARSGLENLDYFINEDGIPCCPHDPSLQMKYEGTCKLRSGVTRYKFVCPKMKWIIVVLQIIVQYYAHQCVYHILRFREFLYS